MKNQAAKGFGWTALAVVIFLALIIINALGIPVFMWIAWILVLGVILGIMWVAPKLRWPIMGIIVVLTIWQGADELAKKFRLPEPRVTIEQNTTYVEAPANIEDPALKEYETAKVGFEKGWGKNVFSGGYLLFAWGYALATLLSILARKAGLGAFSHFGIDLVIFVTGAFVLTATLAPGNCPDYITCEAENNAFWWGAVGPLIWSTVLQFIGTGINYARGMAEQTKNEVVIVLVLVFSYPLMGGLFNLLGFDLLKTLAMSDDLTNSAISLQRWTEMNLMGKFTGMFLPPTIKWIFGTLGYLFKRIFD